jgi:hypothetical protein
MNGLFGIGLIRIWHRVIGIPEELIMLIRLTPVEGGLGAKSLVRLGRRVLMRV